MLFYGPPGSGKTSTILALARDLFGQKFFRSRILELNASDERGISVIREKVKIFAQSAASDISSEEKSKSIVPPFKLIILDEADSLTGDAQTALRRLMEVYVKGTRFCLVCNYVTRIIEPLASRCAKFRFLPVSQEAGIERLREISKQEDIKFMDCTVSPSKKSENEKSGDPELNLLLKCTEGDLRRAVTLLQSAHRLAGISSVEKVVSCDMIADLVGVIPSTVIDEAVQILSKNEGTGSLANIMRFVRKTLASGGYGSAQFLSQLAQQITDDLTMTAEVKAQCAIAISYTDHLLVDGGDEVIQLTALLSNIHRIIHTNS